MSNIILIGFMGCGKSSLGRFISRDGYQLVDTDDLIVQKERRSINDIFESEGETYFRDIETQVIAELAAQKSDRLVVSVGGGLPMREDNRRYMHELGTVVYLRASVATLKKRLAGDKKRPLLKNTNVEAKINELMSKRQSTYEETADLIVDTDDKRFDAIYDVIRKAIQ